MKASHPTKLITCCYCGARSTLPGRTARRDVLVCHGCGAPITRIEKLQPALEKAKARDKSRDMARAGKPAIPHPACTAAEYRAKDHPARRRKAKRRPLFRRLAKALDVDLDLDDVFDVDDWFD